MPAGEPAEIALAAITNDLRIETIIYLPAFSLNMAASVLLGQNLGTGDLERAERVGWKIAKAGGVLISLMALGHFYLGRQVCVPCNVRPSRPR